MNSLLLCQSQNLMAILLGVLAARNMNTEVTTIGGLHDELIKVRFKS